MQSNIKEKELALKEKELQLKQKEIELQERQTSKLTPKKVEVATNEFNSVLTGSCIIISPKSYFFDSPNLQTKRNGYLLQNDIVEVLKNSGDFAYSTFTSSTGRKTTGWILLNDIQKYTENSININSPSESEPLKPNRGKTKYCYVIISTNEPEVKFENKLLPSGSMERKLVPVPSFYTYKSSVMEIKNFTQDDKYKCADQYESQVRRGFSMKNMQLNEYNSECTILSNNCFVFDSYRTASEHRRNN